MEIDQSKYNNTFMSQDKFLETSNDEQKQNKKFNWANPSNEFDLQSNNFNTSNYYLNLFGASRKVSELDNSKLNESQASFNLNNFGLN